MKKESQHREALLFSWRDIRCFPGTKKKKPLRKITPRECAKFIKASWDRIIYGSSRYDFICTHDSMMALLANSLGDAVDRMSHPNDRTAEEWNAELKEMAALASWLRWAVWTPDNNIEFQEENAKFFEWLIANFYDLWD